MTLLGGPKCTFSVAFDGLVKSNFTFLILEFEIEIQNLKTEKKQNSSELSTIPVL